MTERTSPQFAAQTRAELFQRTGWIFATPDVYGELADVGIVQRFTSWCGRYVHDVFVAKGLECSCPGWRKYAKCWHMRWVLAHNVGEGWTFGAYIDRTPTAGEIVRLDRERGWAAWLRERIVVVPAPVRGALREFGCGKCGSKTFEASHREWDYGWGEPPADSWKPIYECASCGSAEPPEPLDLDVRGQVSVPRTEKGDRSTDPGCLASSPVAHSSAARDLATAAVSAMRRLPIVRIGRSDYFIDERLREIRNVENPHERADVGYDVLCILLRESDASARRRNDPPQF